MLSRQEDSHLIAHLKLNYNVELWRRGPISMWTSLNSSLLSKCYSPLPRFVTNTPERFCTHQLQSQMNKFPISM